MMGNMPPFYPTLFAKEGRVMSVEDENKALVRRFAEHGYLEAMRGNLDVVHEYYADHFHAHTSLHPEHSGVQGTKELIADTGQAMPDLRLEVMHIAAEGDLVFVHWRGTATHEQQHQITKHIRHAQPTGEEETISGIHLYRIEDGKFVEAWFYHNILEYAQTRGQAGAATGGS
jgi:predicted SnoaL-like aldol condensation-catalyzing enzyme